MPLCRGYQQRPMEEGLLALGTADLMQIHVFRRVAGIPVKPGAVREQIGELCHDKMYITPIYKWSRKNADARAA
jgi:hypothetical protein